MIVSLIPQNKNNLYYFLYNLKSIINLILISNNTPINDLSFKIKSRYFYGFPIEIDECMLYHSFLKEPR